MEFPISGTKNELCKSNNALEGFRNALRSFQRLNPSNSMEIIQCIETVNIIFIHEKHAVSSLRYF